MAQKREEELKEKKECHDCWRRRFRRDMTYAAQSLKTELPLAFDSLITEREEEEKKVRDNLISLRDEIHELRLLAGDHYMGRYVENEEKR